MTPCGVWPGALDQLRSYLKSLRIGCQLRLRSQLIRQLTGSVGRRLVARAGPTRSPRLTLILRTGHVGCLDTFGYKRDGKCRELRKRKEVLYIRC
jgi:hypothetical protein